MHLNVDTPAVEYHGQLLDGDISATDFISRFMQSEDTSYVHLALWIMAQFSNGSMLNLLLLNLEYLFFSFCNLGMRTRKLLRKSTVMDKLLDLKSRRDSIEIAQLADAAFNNLVS